MLPWLPSFFFSRKKRKGQVCFESRQIDRVYISHYTRLTLLSTPVYPPRSVFSSRNFVQEL